MSGGNDHICLLLFLVILAAGDCASTPLSFRRVSQRSSSLSTTTNKRATTITIAECEAQLSLYDLNQDGSLQPTEFEEIVQTLLPASCNANGTTIKETFAAVCGTNCRFRYAEKAFCTVLEGSIQTHCGSTQNTTTTVDNQTTVDMMSFQYFVAFDIPSNTSYTLLDRQQWLRDAFDQVANGIWRAILSKGRLRRQLDAQSQNKAWILQNSTRNVSSIDLLSLELSSQILDFSELDCHDCWNVTHTVTFYNYETSSTTTTTTATTTDASTKAQLQIFHQRLQMQLPKALVTRIHLPTGVAIQAESQIRENEMTTNTPTVALTPTKAPIVVRTGLQEKGLQSWAIILISVSGALCSAIIYFVWFHTHYPDTHQAVAPLPRIHTTNGQQSLSSSNMIINTTELTSYNGNNNTNKFNLKSNSTRPPTDMISISNGGTTPTDTTPKPLSPQSQTSHNHGQEQEQEQQLQHNGSDQVLEEEEKAEEQAPISSLSSTKRLFPSTHTTAYHVDAAGRIIPISFRSDRDSCIHVFDDESETYNSQWSSSSNSNSAVHQENHDDPKREKEEDCPISTHDKDEDSHKGVDNGTTCPPAHITHVISDASSDSKNTDEAPYYGGVYYGEKDDNGETPLKQSQLFQDVMVDTEIPVYGGVYYGSDEEPPKEAAMPDANLNVDVDVDVDPPSVDYFAGIRICRNPSTSSVSTLSKEHTHDVGEECSFDSFRSKESSLMSAEEREWQRRLREDLLHPVTEDAAIVDATIVNLSGFTKEGDGRKRNRRRNKG